MCRECVRSRLLLVASFSSSFYYVCTVREVCWLWRAMDYRKITWLTCENQAGKSRLCGYTHTRRPYKWFTRFRFIYFYCSLWWRIMWRDKQVQDNSVWLHHCGGWWLFVYSIKWEWMMEGVRLTSIDIFVTSDRCSSILATHDRLIHKVRKSSPRRRSTLPTKIRRVKSFVICRNASWGTS